MFAKFCQKKMRKSLTKCFWYIEVWAVQKHANLVDLVKSFPTNILLENLASIQQRTSLIKFDHLAEKSESALRYRIFQLRREGEAEWPRHLSMNADIWPGRWRQVAWCRHTLPDWETSQGSFSTVSEPNFASKYVLLKRCKHWLCNIFQFLRGYKEDLHICSPV